MKPPRSRTSGPGIAHLDMSDNSLIANHYYIRLFMVTTGLGPAGTLRQKKSICTAIPWEDDHDKKSTMRTVREGGHRVPVHRVWFYERLQGACRQPRPCPPAR